MLHDTIHVTDHKDRFIRSTNVVQVDSTVYNVHHYFAGTKDIGQTLEDLISRKIEQCS